MKTIKQIQEGFFNTSGAGIQSAKEKIIDILKDLTSKIKYMDYQFDEKYTINDDMSVDWDGSIFLDKSIDNYIKYKDLDKLPIKFNKISGLLSIHNFNISSCENFPSEIGESLSFFKCQKLTNLSGLKSNIKGGIKLNFLNNLENIEALKDCYIDKFIYITYCPNIFSLKGLPKTINGDIILTNLDGLSSLKYITDNISGSLNISSCDKLNIDTSPKKIGMNLYYNQSPSNPMYKLCSYDDKKFTDYIKNLFSKSVKGDISNEYLSSKIKYKYYK